MTSITEEVQADAAFGTDMYLKLAATGNVVFSPASIAAALRMATPPPNWRPRCTCRARRPPPTGSNSSPRSARATT
jgi:hypothetical protein